MFTREELKNNLIGCAEIALFMPNGVERYDSSKSAAIRSFLVTLILLPAVVAVWAYRAGSVPAGLVVGLHLAHFVLSALLFLTVVYFLSKQYNREEHFFRFITAVNWQGVTGVFLVFPVLAAVLFGWDIEPWENYSIFVTLLSYVYTGFIVTYVFRIPWELGGFVAVIALAVDQNLLEVVKHLQDYLGPGI